jgi:hypothetical protein
MYQSAPGPLLTVKREEQGEQENQTTRKRALAELNVDDHKEGEIFDEHDNYMNDEFFSSLHPDWKKLRLTTTTNVRVDPLAFGAAESQAAGWRDFDFEDQMSWIGEQEAPSCLGDVSFGNFYSVANNLPQHLRCRLLKISPEMRSSLVRSLLIESVPFSLTISRV